MESPDQLSRQIESLEDLQSIVKTMKALSAVSIRQYERAVESLAEYFHTIELGLRVVLRAGDVRRHETETAQGHYGAVVFGSDHGLCGRFNEDVTEHLLARLAQDAGEERRRHFIAVGARVAMQLEANDLTLDETFWVPGSADRITATVQEVLQKIEAWRAEDGVECVYLYYNAPSDRGRYEPTSLQILPLDTHRFRHLEREPWPSKRVPTYSMDTEALLSALIRQYYFIALFRACAQSQASEHASRLAAMQSAERNLDERLEDETAHYRRVRQNAITGELLDVVAGFEAMKPGR
ncbi:F0F1 ATP synthase subunit gamma [Thioalkalivibrio sp.]|uniref:F0F1 ATP synthase subunit gamma n=1 Tax=Thioalkalivibrio sp. TaxID=2093813 RepID=UPI003976EDE7